MIIETPLPGNPHRGKVRDTFDLGDGRLLMVSTDRLSAFDVVLPGGIPDKGQVLNRLSAFWFLRTPHIVRNHLVGGAYDPAVESYLQSTHLWPHLTPEIMRQAMVVKRAERIDIECIVRGYITGSAWSEYRRQGTVSGQQMPAGLVEGQQFPEPLFTPTTKADEGHDENMSPEEVVALVGPDMARKLEDTSKAVYQFAQAYARERGIILADTKMEFGTLDGELILIDELLTPDSSRFWDAEGYAPGQSQPNFDKQFVRDWLDEQGWNHEPPAPELPPDIVRRTTERYKAAYRRITGVEL